MFACPLNRRRDHARRSWKCAACFPRRLCMPARLTASAHRLNHAPREHLTMQVARACSQSCNSGSPSTFISLRRIPVHDPADPCMQNLTASPVRIAFKSSGSRLHDPPRHALLYHPDHARRGPRPAPPHPLPARLSSGLATERSCGGRSPGGQGVTWTHDASHRQVKQGEEVGGGGGGSGMRGTRGTGRRG